MRAISRREVVAEVVGVGVDLGLARGAIKVVEVDLIRSGIAADAISLAAGDAGIVVAADATTAGDGVVVVEAEAIFTAVEDAIAAVAADVISAAGESVVDVVEAEAGVSTARSAAAVDRSVP